METKEIEFIKREFQEEKALCLFKFLYEMDNDFELAPYVMGEVAHMFKEELNKSITSYDDIQSNFDLICAVFSLTDKAINGDKKAKEIASIFMQVININDISQKVKNYVVTECMLNSQKSA